MEYDSEAVIKSFIKRTYLNLEQYLKLHEEAPQKYPYDNTQIINSLLGIIAFPYQAEREFISTIDVNDLLEKMRYEKNKSAERLFYHLRNAICHCRLFDKVETDIHTREIVAITFTDRSGINGQGPQNFELRLEVHEMKELAKKIYNAVIANENNQ